MLKRFGFALGAILAVGMLASCVINTSSDDKDEGTSSGVDFSDHTKSGDFALIVKNNTQKNLVCFRSNPSKETLIGGVRGGAQVGLKKNTKIFTSTSDFVLFLITEEDYKENIDNLEALKNAPFGQVYAYYNADQANTRVYEISAHMGGNCKLIVNNTTKFNVELREGGLYEPALGYVASMDIRKSFPLEMPDSDMYYVYPVFRKFDKKSGEIISSFPKYSDTGKNVVVPFGFDAETTSHEFDADIWVGKDAFDMSPSCAYLMVENQSSAGALQLYEGSSEALQTTAGYTVINPNHPRMFDIEMAQLTSETYQTEREIATFRYGNAAVGKKNLPKQTYKAGYMYTFRIFQKNGSMDPSNTYGYFAGTTVSFEGDTENVTGTATEEKYVPEDKD